MKPPTGRQDISVENMMGAKLENLIRLANFLGIDIEKLKELPDAKWRISCAIARWNKRNPQPKIRS
jgi:hypothetical protein